MTTDDLTAILRHLDGRKPFLRYQLFFSSGDQVEVRHPETIRQQGDVFTHACPDRVQLIFSAAGVSNIRVFPPLDRPAPE
jgi:hypothetical protein